MEAVAELDAVEELVESQTEEQPTEAAAEAPAPPAEIPPEPSAECPPHIREHYEQIREKERAVYKLESEYLSLKEEASSAKREFEAADKELRNLIARGADPQRQLPFEKPGEVRKPNRIKLLVDLPGTTMKAGFEPVFTVDDAGDVLAVWNDGNADQTVLLELDQYEVIEWENGDEDQPATEATNDAWRSAPFAELGLSLKQNELFEAIGVTTIGGLEDLRARMANGDFSAQWPKGIGPAKVTDIENRVIDWLDKNRDKFGEAVDAGGRTLWGTELPPAPVAQSTEPVIPEPEAAEAVHENGNGKAKHKANGKAKAKGKKRK